MAAQAKNGRTATDSSSDKTTSSESNGADLLSKLPTRKRWSHPFVLFKNYWIHPYFIQNIISMQTTFKPRHDDIILASSPKCGTTWMKALAFTIINRSRYEFWEHPLLFHHPQEVVPSMEISQDKNHLNHVETLPSPRLLATHMPLSLFPETIASWGCRVVYICRDPKDAFVSWWHFANKINREDNIDLEYALDIFCQGFSPYGPFWEHCLEYWRESTRSPDKILFLKYEDMILEPLKHVKRLAVFLGVPFNIKEEEDGVPEEVVRLCSFEKLTSLHTNQEGELIRNGNKIVIDKSVFFRKGMVGDWVNHMSKEMGKKIDYIVEEKLKGSGLQLS